MVKWRRLLQGVGYKCACACAYACVRACVRVYVGVRLRGGGRELIQRTTKGLGGWGAKASASQSQAVIQYPQSRGQSL